MKQTWRETYIRDSLQAEHEIRRLFSEKDFTTKEGEIRSACRRFFMSHRNNANLLAANVSVACCTAPFPVNYVAVGTSVYKGPLAKALSPKGLVEASIASRSEDLLSLAILNFPLKTNEVYPRLALCLGMDIYYGEVDFNGDDLQITFSYHRSGKTLPVTMRRVSVVNEFDGNRFRTFYDFIKRISPLY